MLKVDSGAQKFELSLKGSMCGLDARGFLGCHFSDVYGLSAAAAEEAGLEPEWYAGWTVRPSRIPSSCTRSTRAGIEWCCLPHRA